MLPVAEKWESDLRAAIRGTCGKGWTARKGGADTTQLIYRPPEPFERAYRTNTVSKPPQQTGTIHLAWHINNKSQILEAAQTASRLVAKGTHLTEAAQLAFGPTPLGPLLDWDALIERYGEHRVRYSGQISPRTWQRMSLPHLRKWLSLMAGNTAPTTAAEAFRRLPLGQPGSAGRRHRVDCICKFLEWGVSQGFLGAEWAPSTKRTELHGQKPKTNQTVFDNTLTDGEIEMILADISKPHWWWVFSALALYGLRPEEVVHLALREDGLWCTYQKRNQHGATKPRRLYALEPFKGLEERWLQRWAIRNNLTDMGRNKGGVGLAMTIFLRSHKYWHQLKSDESRSVVPYSFRHSYALRGARAGIAPRFMATAMGHSLNVHLTSYSKFVDDSSMEAAFSKAR